jgi:hypothetical protein
VNVHSGCVAALVGGLVVSAANGAVTFSFSSDGNNDGPTFAGDQFVLSDGADFDANNSVIVGLLVDPNGDLPGGGITFNSLFEFQAETTGYDIVEIEPGLFVHSWTMSGSFTFTETGTGIEVLQIDFDNAVFNSVSSSSGLLGGTATLQAHAATGSVAFTPGSPLLGLGIDASDLAFGEGFAFSLTNLAAAAGAGSVGVSDGAWATEWISEGSFSAAASAIPAPGAMALLVGAMLAQSRRRRA